jgi:hypothetical protein
MKFRLDATATLLTAIFLTGTFLTCLRTPPAFAWTPASQIAIGENAASIAPPDLARQISRHRKEFRRGVLAPFESTTQSVHVKNANGSGNLDRTVHSATARAIDAIVTHKPFAEVVYKLGVVAHFVADANNPLNSSDADPDELAYFADYLRYIDSARERYPIVFYGEGRDLRESGDLRRLVGSSLHRGRDLYPMIGAEYERVGRIDGISLFDDRSTAFGIGSLSVSHAVSDIAAVLRYIWLQSGGGDGRLLELTRPQTYTR